MSSRADGRDREQLRQIGWTTTFGTLFVGVATYMPCVSAISLDGSRPQGMAIGVNEGAMSGAAPSLSIGSATFPNWMVAAFCLAAGALYPEVPSE